MTIEKQEVVEKIEVVFNWNIQVATDTKIMEDSKEIARTRKRHVLVPCTSSKDADGKWTHTDTDISAEDDTVKAVCNAVWTDTVKANYKTWKESQEV